MKPSKPSFRLKLKSSERDIFLRSLDLFDNLFTEYCVGAEDFRPEIVERRLAASDKLALEVIRMILNLMKTLDLVKGEKIINYWKIKMKIVEYFMDIHVKAVTTKQFLLKNSDHPSNQELKGFLDRASTILKKARLSWKGFVKVQAEVSDADETSGGRSTEDGTEVHEDYEDLHEDLIDDQEVSFNKNYNNNNNKRLIFQVINNKVRWLQALHSNA